jgi:hypothetical protein
MYERFDTFDIQNGALKSIILRLMQNCLYSDPQIRLCCVEGLGKLAFTNPDPIRIFIYEFLFNIKDSYDFGITTETLNILHLLNELYEVDEILVDLMEITNCLTEEKYEKKILRFYQKHDSVVEKITCLCNIQNFHEFYPLGQESKDYLTKGIEILSKIDKIKL